MKKGLKSLLVYIMIFYFVLSLFSGSFVLPESFLYLSITFLVLAVSLMIVCPLLGFLTVKCKFPTFLLMGSLILTGVFYVLKLFMIDFYIESYLFEGMDWGFIQLNSFDVTPIISIVLCSFFVSFFVAFYRELDSGN